MFFTCIVYLHKQYSIYTSPNKIFQVSAISYFSLINYTCWISHFLFFSVSRFRNKRTWWSTSLDFLCLSHYVSAFVTSFQYACVPGIFIHCRHYIISL